MAVLQTGLRKYWKLAAALTLIAVAVLALLRNLLFVNVADAFVNATLVPVLSPIPGQVVEPLPPPGTRVSATSVVRISNERADETLAIQTSERLQEIEAELESAKARRIPMQASIEELAGWSRRYVKARDAYLGQRLTEARSQVAASREELRKAEYNHNRLQEQSLYVSRNMLDEASTAVEVARQALNAAEARQAQVVTEREALAQRIQISDSYSERTFSEQRLQETHLQLATLDAQIAALEHQRRAMAESLERSQRQLGRETEATVALQDAVVWRRIPAGSQVGRGGTVGEIAPCEDAVITVTLERSAFRKLHVGMPATASLRLPDGERRRVRASVVTLTGGSLQNVLGTAIPFGRAIVENAYGAVLRVDDPQELDCAIGRPVDLRIGKE